MLTPLTGCPAVLEVESVTISVTLVDPVSGSSTSVDSFTQRMRTRIG